MWWTPSISEEEVDAIVNDAKTKHTQFSRYREDFVNTLLKKMMDGGDFEPHTANERYTFIESKHTTKPSCTMGDPIMENPCSYESVEKVFDEILRGAADSQRAWAVIGCDALPYTIGHRVLESIHSCPVCGADFLSEQELTEHCLNTDHRCDAKKCRKYKDIMLLPGLGHYEINMVKALFKLLWDVGLCRLAKMLGFNSPKAQLSCQSASDHHKSWQIIQIFMYSMSFELLQPYLEHASLQQECPTAEGYFQWIPQGSDMQKFLSEAVFTYCLSVHVFRAGVRRNNSDAINAAKARFAPLFYGLSMPFYMETFFRDSVLRTKCPPLLLNFLKNHESYSVSGNDCKGEGGDFVLESFNRKVKRLLPSGLPDDQGWIRACRNVERMTAIHDYMINILGVSDDDEDGEYTYVHGIKDEVVRFRSIIKESGILSSEKLEGMCGEKLASDIRYLTEKCEANFNEYAKEVSTTNSLLKRFRPKPVTISQKQRDNAENIQNLTKSQLKDRIEKFEMNDTLQNEWRKLKNGKKDGFVNFLKKLEKD